MARSGSASARRRGRRRKACPRRSCGPPRGVEERTPPCRRRTRPADRAAEGHEPGAQAERSDVPAAHGEVVTRARLSTQRPAPDAAGHVERVGGSRIAEGPSVGGCARSTGDALDGALGREARDPGRESGRRRDRQQEEGGDGASGRIAAVRRRPSGTTCARRRWWRPAGRPRVLEARKGEHRSSGRPMRPIGCLVFMPPTRASGWPSHRRLIRPPAQTALQRIPGGVVHRDREVSATTPPLGLQAASVVLPRMPLMEALLTMAGAPPQHHRDRVMQQREDT
jgi:hypothetical protein